MVDEKLEQDPDLTAKTYSDSPIPSQGDNNPSQSTSEPVVDENTICDSDTSIKTDLEDSEQIGRVANEMVNDNHLELSGEDSLPYNDNNTSKKERDNSDSDGSNDMGNSISSNGTYQDKVQKVIRSHHHSTKVRGDSIAEGATIQTLIQNVYGRSSESQDTSENKPEPIISNDDKPGFLKDKLSIETLKFSRQRYIKRPGHDSALQFLRSKHVLLLMGPYGCDLDTSVAAVSLDLYDELLDHGRGKQLEQIYRVHSYTGGSPAILLREILEMKNAIILIEDGLATSRSIATRLFRNNENSNLSHLDAKLVEINSWLIVTNDIGSIDSQAHKTYEIFNRYKYTAELGMPEMQVFLDQIVTHEFSKRADMILEFLSTHFPGVVQTLRTVQDVEHFARQAGQVIVDEPDIDTRKREVSRIVTKLLDNAQSNIERLLEYELKHDSDVLLAMLLSVLNGTERNLFWSIFNEVNTALKQRFLNYDQPVNKTSRTKDNTNTTESAETKTADVTTETKSTGSNAIAQANDILRRDWFRNNHAASLRAIRAEEVQKSGVFKDGETIVGICVTYVDSRDADLILHFFQNNYRQNVKEVCDILNVVLNRNIPDVNVRISIIEALTDLALSNWNGIFVPLVAGWAAHEDRAIRARVGYAIDWIFNRGIYTGNARALLNTWITAPIGGQTSWYVKWTVASVCKTVGLTDIDFGLSYLKLLAENVGARDLRNVKSEEDLAILWLDSKIESEIVYDAIRYAMIVFCLNGYMEDVIQELQRWISNSNKNSPLALIATLLFINIFQEFGKHAQKNHQIANNKVWKETVLTELGVRIYKARKTAYIYNQALQYFVEHRNESELFDALTSTFINAFVLLPTSEHGEIYEIFIQWANELYEGRHVSEIKEVFKKSYKIFLQVYKKLNPTRRESIRNQIESFQKQIDEAEEDPNSVIQLPEGVKEFIYKINQGIESIDFT